MNYIDDKISERLGGIRFGSTGEIYKFERIKRAKAEAKKNRPGIHLIDMGVGEPDLPADPEVVKTLSREAGKPENRWYADNGIPEFQEAAAAYLENVYNVKNIDPGKHILHGIGSKPILAMLPLCFINPGDIALTTVPGYPVTATYTKYLGGSVYKLPLREENGFFPDFDSIPGEILKKAKLLYLNYPNNPTGRIATPEFYRRTIKFARQNNIVVIQAAAYGALTYDDCRPLSLLSLEGADQVGVEVHSLSKAFNMTGWRLAFLAGNEKIIKAYGTVKDNTDSGQFRAIQQAGISALKNPVITKNICDKYSRRFDLLISALKEVGFSAEKPGATFYCYVKCPVAAKSGIAFANASDFSDYLIREALISTVPWDEAGSYVRFSVTFEADTPESEISIINEMKERLMGLELIF